MREVLTTWTTPSGGGHTTVMYTDPSLLIENVRLNLQEFYEGIENALSTQVSWVIATEGRNISAATGEVTGFWAEGTTYVGTGGGTGQPVADATQVLVRWRTDEVVRGRRLQGRTFLPGLNIANVSNGNLQGSTNTLIAGFAADLVDTGTLLVWSRPPEGGEGIAAPVTDSSVWSELAVLRSRRG